MIVALSPFAPPPSPAHLLALGGGAVSEQHRVMDHLIAQAELVAQLQEARDGCGPRLHRGSVGGGESDVKVEARDGPGPRL